jgi:hypothetical protein
MDTQVSYKVETLLADDSISCCQKQIIMHGSEKVLIKSGDGGFLFRLYNFTVVG